MSQDAIRVNASACCKFFDYEDALVQMISKSVNEGVDPIGSRIDPDTGIRYAAYEPAKWKDVSSKTGRSRLADNKAFKQKFGKLIDLSKGDPIGVRLNINFLNNFGVPVQSVHQAKTANPWSEPVVAYSHAVTVRNPEFQVHQKGVYEIANRIKSKYPMAAVVGEYVPTPPDMHRVEGEIVSFNPMRSHLFTTVVNDRHVPVKSVRGTVTIHGTRVYVHPGSTVEYWGDDAPEPYRPVVKAVENANEQAGNAIKFGKGGKPFDPSQIVPRGNPLNYPGRTSYPSRGVAAGSSLLSTHRSDLLRAAGRLSSLADIKGTTHELITPHKYFNLLTSRGVHPDEAAIFGVHKGQANLHPAEGMTAKDWEKSVYDRGISYATSEYTGDDIQLPGMHFKTMDTSLRPEYKEWSKTLGSNKYASNLKAEGILSAANLAHFPHPTVGMSLQHARFTDETWPEKGRTLVLQEAQNDVAQKWKKTASRIKEATSGVRDAKATEADLLPLHDVLWQPGSHFMNLGGLQRTLSGMPVVVPPMAESNGGWDYAEFMPWLVSTAIEHGYKGVTLPHPKWMNGYVEDRPEQHVSRRAERLAEAMQAMHQAWGGELTKDSLENLSGRPALTGDLNGYYNAMRERPILSWLGDASKEIHQKANDQEWVSSQLKKSRPDDASGELDDRVWSDWQKNVLNKPISFNLAIELPTKTGQIAKPISLSTDQWGNIISWHDDQFSLPINPSGRLADPLGPFEGHVYGPGENMSVGQIESWNDKFERLQIAVHKAIARHNNEAFQNPSSDNVPLSPEDHVTLQLHMAEPFVSQDKGDLVVGPLVPFASTKVKVSDLANLNPTPYPDLMKRNNPLVEPISWKDVGWRTMPVWHWQFPQELIDHVMTHGYAPFRGLEKFNRANEHLRNVTKAVRQNTSRMRRRPVIIHWNSPVQSSYASRSR